MVVLQPTTSNKDIPIIIILSTIESPLHLAGTPAQGKDNKISADRQEENFAFKPALMEV